LKEFIYLFDIVLYPSFVYVMAAALGGVAAATGILNAGSKLIDSITGGASKVKGTMSGSDQRRVALGQRRKRQKPNRQNRTVQALPPTPVAKNFKIVNNGLSSVAAGRNKTFRQSEVVMDVKSDMGFKCTELNYSPANKNSFPLSGPACANYTKFIHRGTRVVFTPIKETGYTGLLMISYTKNATDQKPDSEFELMSRQGSAKSAVRNKLELFIPGDGQKQFWLVPGNSLQSGQDPQNSYPFALWIGVDSCDATGDKLGTLEIFHDILLIDFKATTEDLSQFDIYNDTASGTGVTKDAPLGTAGSVCRDNSLNAQIATDGTQIYLNARGTYHIEVFAFATDAITALPITLTSGKMVLKQTYVDGDLGSSGYTWHKKIAVVLDGDCYLDLSVTTGGNLVQYALKISPGNKVKVTTLNTFTAI
jgi:hypothetical protein